MKIGELIDRLERIKEKEGDIDVVVDDIAPLTEADFIVDKYCSNDNKFLHIGDT